MDAVTILERIREDEMENEGEQPSPHPDILSGLRESGSVIMKCSSVFITHDSVSFLLKQRIMFKM